MSAQSDQAQQILEVVPYLRTKPAKAAIEFYQQVFGAEVTYKLDDPDGRIGHAELRFGSMKVMVSDEYPEYGILSPLAYNGTGSTVHLQVTDVDAIFQRAIAAGGKSTMDPQDMFYGQRHAKFRDPFGHEWGLGKEIKQISQEEVQRQYNEMALKK